MVVTNRSEHLEGSTQCFTNYSLASDAAMHNVHIIVLFCGNFFYREISQTMLYFLLHWQMQ